MTDRAQDIRQQFIENKENARKYFESIMLDEKLKVTRLKNGAYRNIRVKRFWEFFCSWWKLTEK